MAQPTPRPSDGIAEQLYISASIGSGYHNS